MTTVAESLPGWDEPRCLIGYFTDDKLEVDKKILSMLDEVTDPVVVVSIVGLYRTGKSYLLNRLTGREHGFALGFTIEAKTRGIWIWCVRHPRRQECVLLLLDTEGFGDVEKSDINHDIWIFSLAVLLSSILVYNSIGAFSNETLKILHLVTSLAEHINVKSNKNEDESEEFHKFFPSFIWTIRDFTLDLAKDGETITENDYLEGALQLKPGSGEQVSEYNLPRKCITSYFPNRKCIIFPVPVNNIKLLKKLESVSDSEFIPEFLEHTRTFVDHVLNYEGVKKINGQSVTGRLFGGLVSCYVDAIRNGAVPCIESAVETMKQMENERAIKKAVEHYKNMFISNVTFPTDTLLELSYSHDLCQKESVKYFMTLAIFDSENVFQNRLKEELYVAYKNFITENEAKSRETCISILDSLYQSIAVALKNEMYSRSRGHAKYIEDVTSLVQSYHQTPRKGIMSEEVLNEFRKSKEPTAASIEVAENIPLFEIRVFELLQMQRSTVTILNTKNKQLEEHIKTCLIGYVLACVSIAAGVAGLIAAPYTGGASLVVAEMAEMGLMTLTSTTAVVVGTGSAIRTKANDYLWRKGFIEEVNKLLLTVRDKAVETVNSPFRRILGKLEKLGGDESFTIIFTRGNMDPIQSATLEFKKILGEAVESLIKIEFDSKDPILKSIKEGCDKLEKSIINLEKLLLKKNAWLQLFHTQQ